MGGRNGPDTFENRQSEFLQVVWQVVGWPILYVGSPSSKENDDRLEAKIDALLELVGSEGGLALVREIDDTHLRRGGHPDIHHKPPTRATPDRRGISPACGSPPSRA